MEYDKNSFLAGIAVGRQLKGWATGAGSGSGGGGLEPFVIQPLQLNSPKQVPVDIASLYLILDAPE